MQNSSAAPAARSVAPARDPAEDFSLVLGGPLYQLLLNSGLIRPPLGNVGSRIAVITGLAWLPLVLLTILGGRFASSVHIPFLYDYEVHARLLFSVPLLVLAEVVVYFRMRAIAAQFLERHIVTNGIRSSFDAVLASASRMRNSITAEIVIALLVFIGGPFLWRGTVALQSETWYAVSSAVGTGLTAAGRWYAFVSVPIF